MFTPTYLFIVTLSLQMYNDEKYSYESDEIT